VSFTCIPGEALRHKQCAQCSKPFTPNRPLQAVCSAICAKRKAVAYRKATEAAKRAETRERREKVKTLSQHKAEAQRALNSWIVHGRDKGKPCISCGASAREGDQAGHYRTRGSSPHLALDPRNLARQCVRCNLHLHGNPIGFRAGLVARHGDAFVQELEADQTPRKYTAAELAAIKQEYRAKLKALQQEKA
jgi:hypothetical protein